MSGRAHFVKLYGLSNYKKAANQLQLLNQLQIPKKLQILFYDKFYAAANYKSCKFSEKAANYNPYKKAANFKKLQIAPAPKNYTHLI